jgi:hypothetical protein
MRWSLNHFKCFIASLLEFFAEINVLSLHRFAICPHCLNALSTKKITHRRDEEMVFIIFVAKPKNFAVSAYTYVSRISELFYGNFCMNLYFVDSDEARRWSIKHCITSSFKKHSMLHRFIATNFYPALNASSPLLFKENSHLTLHCCYFFKEIHRFMLQRCYFLK